MRKSYLLFLFVIFYHTSFAQTDKTNFAQIDSTKIIYCEIVGSSVLFGNKVTVEIDMGQNTGFLAMNTSYIIDENTGKWKKFNSMIDAMNFMGGFGWDFVQAYAVSYTNNSAVYHFLLKQVVIKENDGNYYPTTRRRGK